MNTAALRVLDRTLGALACAAFFPLILLLRLTRRSAKGRPRRILFLKFFGMGSLVRAWPLFESVRRRHPSARIHLLTFRSNLEIAERLGVFHRVLTVDPGGGGLLAAQVLSRMARLVAGRYEIVMDLEFFSNFSAFLALLTLAPVRVGYSRPGVGSWIHTRHVPYDSLAHISEVYAALARSVDADATRAGAPALVATEGDRARADRLLGEAGIRPGEPLLVVNPASSDLSLERRWPAESFAWICDELEGQARAVLIGSLGERGVAEDVLARLRRARVVNLAGRTDLGSLLAILRRASVVVSNDSGPAHLADALGVRSVVLYGPESPRHYGLTGPDHALFHLGLACSPCLNVRNRKTAPCGGRNACMRLLPREAVLEAVRTLLNGTALPAERRSFWNGFGGRWAGRDWTTAEPGAQATP